MISLQEKLDRIKEDFPSARIALLGNAIVASPELDTNNTVKLLNEFMTDVESQLLRYDYYFNLFRNQGWSVRNMASIT